MRRADRLFRITEILKHKRHAITAQQLATELEVSVRTIYRDIADLMASHVPIIGEAGTGYVLDKRYVIKPMMFDAEELDALVLGAQMVESWGDKDIAKSAKRALDKICSGLPPSLSYLRDDAVLFSLPSEAKPLITIDFGALRRAIREKQLVQFDYLNAQKVPSARTARPLALAFFGPVWLLLGWCELRNDFRNFRLDRMSSLIISDTKFENEKGKRLQDYKHQLK